MKKIDWCSNKYTDGFVSTSTAALRCFRLRVCVSSASSVSSLISNDVTSNDDCLDLPLSSLPNLAILERSLSPLPVCSSQPAFERSREKGHAMLSSLRIPLLEGIEDMNNSDSLQLCHTVDKDRSIGWHQVNKRTQRSRYAALSCLSAISCAVHTDSALPSSSFFLHHNWPIVQTFNVPLADSSSLSCLVLVSANPLASLPLELVPGQTPAAATVHPRAPSASDWPRYHFTDSTNGIHLSSPTLFVPR